MVTKSSDLTIYTLPPNHTSHFKNILSPGMGGTMVKNGVAASSNFYKALWPLLEDCEDDLAVGGDTYGEGNDYSSSDAANISQRNSHPCANDAASEGNFLEVSSVATAPSPPVSDSRPEKGRDANATSRATSMDRIQRELSETFQPCCNTVIVGRGKGSKQNQGNRRLQAIVVCLLTEYSMSENKRTKTRIVDAVIAKVHENGGIFVKYVKKGQKEMKSQGGSNNVNQDRIGDGAWYEVSELTAREKVGYMFRDLLSDKYRSSSKFKVEARRSQLKQRRQAKRQQRYNVDPSLFVRASTDGVSTSSPTPSSSNPHTAVAANKKPEMTTGKQETCESGATMNPQVTKSDENLHGRRLMMSDGQHNNLEMEREYNKMAIQKSASYGQAELSSSETIHSVLNSNNYDKNNNNDCHHNQDRANNKTTIFCAGKSTATNMTTKDFSQPNPNAMTASGTAATAMTVPVPTTTVMSVSRQNRNNEKGTTTATITANSTASTSGDEHEDSLLRLLQRQEHDCGLPSNFCWDMMMQDGEEEEQHHESDDNRAMMTTMTATTSTATTNTMTTTPTKQFDDDSFNDDAEESINLFEDLMDSPLFA